MSFLLLLADWVSTRSIRTLDMQGDGLFVRQELVIESLQTPIASTFECLHVVQ